MGVSNIQLYLPYESKYQAQVFNAIKKLDYLQAIYYSLVSSKETLQKVKHYVI